MARDYAAYLSFFLLFVAYIMLMKAYAYSFLKADLPSGAISFHAFKTTDSAHSTCVVLPDIPPFSQVYFGVLTSAMQMGPSLLGCLLFTFIQGSRRSTLRSATQWDSYLFLVAISFIFTFMWFLIDLVSWLYVERQLLGQGIHAELGNAHWAMFGACLAIFLSWCAGITTLQQLEAGVDKSS